MTKIVPGQHYTILGQNALFLAVKHQDKLMLRDVNRSARWEGGRRLEEDGPIVWLPVGFFQGYRVKGRRLVFTHYDFEGGMVKPHNDCRPDISLDFVQPCRAETIVVDMADWAVKTK